MRHVLYMAWRYVRYHWIKTVVLVASISLILFIPLGLQVIVRQASEMLTARAASTPLIIGAKGSALDLTLASLYFRSPSVAPIVFRELASVNGTGLATAIPLYLRHSASGYRIVGTTTDYFEFGGLEVTKDRPMAILGECVLGARVAQSLGLGPDSALFSSPAGAFDVAGTFPLRMRVVGVLAPLGTPDDLAVFTDLKTAWVISGLAHGHMDMTAPGSESGVLEQQEGNVVANPSVLSYTEITPDNIDSFHFHGDPGTFPIDAIIAVPRDRRSGIMLRGRFEAQGGAVQLLVPLSVINDLLETVLSVRDFVVMGSVGVGAATLATAVLVFTLSIRLRRREIDTMRKIGGAGQRIRAILAAEILLVVGLAALVAALLVGVIATFGSTIASMVLH